MGIIDGIYNVLKNIPTLGISILFSYKFWFGIFIGVILLGGICFYYLRKRLKATQVKLNLPFGLGNIVYEATDQDRELAWKMFVQLKTRKAALPFDEKYDVIIDVLDSLHEVFPITRELLSEANPHQGEEQKSIADFVLRVLNDGIRPLLTHWHAIYRRWWDKAIETSENINKPVNDIQRMFPQYKELIADLKKMNDELANYAEELLSVVYSSTKKEKSIKKIKVIPEAPIKHANLEESGNTIKSKKQEIITLDKEKS